MIYGDQSRQKLQSGTFLSDLKYLLTFGKYIYNYNT